LKRDSSSGKLVCNGIAEMAMGLPNLLPAVSLLMISLAASPRAVLSTAWWDFVLAAGVMANSLHGKIGLCERKRPEIGEKPVFSGDSGLQTI
jgi:hypothetical protein